MHIFYLYIFFIVLLYLFAKGQICNQNLFIWQSLWINIRLNHKNGARHFHSKYEILIRKSELLLMKAWNGLYKHLIFTAFFVFLRNYIFNKFCCLFYFKYTFHFLHVNKRFFILISILRGWGAIDTYLKKLQLYSFFVSGFQIHMFLVMRSILLISFQRFRPYWRRLG